MGFQYPFTCNPASLTADFALRDGMPQTTVAQSSWYQLEDNGEYVNSGWGPRPVTFQKIKVPTNACCDGITWQRERIIAVALRYLNTADNPKALNYRHHHIPAWNPPTDTFPSGDQGQPEMDGNSAWAAGSGLDCSNFASWVYNFGLGIKFTSNVEALAKPSLGIPAKQLPKEGPFQPGDLIYLHPTNDSTRVSHVVIYLNNEYVIDDRYDYVGPDDKPLRGVQLRPRTGWYRRAVIGGWRIIGE